MYNCTSTSVQMPESRAYVRLLGHTPVIVFGILSNSINTVIFSRKKMTMSTINWFLLALSICDLCVLVSSFVVICLPALATLYEGYHLVLVYPYLVRWSYPVASMCHTMGVYLTVLVSCFRYLGICHPFRARRWISPNSVKAGISGAALFSVSFNFCRFFEVEVAECYSLLFGTIMPEISVTSLTQQRSYQLLYMMCLYTIFMLVLPFIVLFLMNLFMIRALREAASLGDRINSQKILSKSLASNSKPPEKESSSSLSVPNCYTPRRKASIGGSKDPNITKMVLAMVTLFLVTNCIPFVNNILVMVDSFMQWTHFVRWFSYFVEVGNFMVLINSAANIFIYFGFSSNYRDIIESFVRKTIAQE